VNSKPQLSKVLYAGKWVHPPPPFSAPTAAPIPAVAPVTVLFSNCELEHTAATHTVYFTQAAPTAAVAPATALL
jgi:hypothetical protein